MEDASYESYFEHGGNTFTRPVRLDFSSNLNPLGMPAAAREALARSLREPERIAAAYPDPHARRLTGALAEALELPERYILCTAGASDMITRTCLALRPRRALVTAPCFAGYERALVGAGCAIMRHRLRASEGFDVTERILEDLEACYGVQLVILCTPNNPTGRLIDLSLIQRIVKAAAERGAHVLLDETFLGFSGAPSARSLLEGNPNLIIVDALTKLYALAGLRVGFGLCADAQLLARIERAGAEWPITTLAQDVGCAALADAAFPRRTRTFISDERERLAGALRATGAEVVSPHANFILLKSPRELFKPLLDQGILIRPCARYQGLDDTWYRVAVRLPHENDQLVEAVKAIEAIRPVDPIGPVGSIKGSEGAEGSEAAKEVICGR